jgi:hypothetical protein
LVPFWLQLFVSAERVLTSWFGEPRILWSILTCSRARPQPVVWMAPACARFLCATAVLSGHVLSPWFDEPRQARRVLRAAVVDPGHVLSPWFDEPRRARRAFRARPPTQSVSCCSAVSLCRREVAQWMLSSVLENSGLITSCAAYPRDPASPVSSNHSTVCPCAGYLQDAFNCDHQLINTDTPVTKNGPGNNFRR